MRYDAEHKQKTRSKVLEVAAQAIRKDGPDRIGVAGVMAEAGLTHGGFYAHFKSKDELVTAAIGQMFEESRARFVHEMEGRSPAEGLSAYIDFYLSARHRDMRGAGCPMAALASDLPRLPDDARALFAEGARRLTGALARKFEAMAYADPQALARSTVSELVGALSLARVETDTQRSDAILADSRRLLKQRLGLEPTA
ncbi:transcriptional regulator, TetR family [Dyella jiangningensis]|uniref:TetR/AcrR family transcriptional regulator n=1 Tax=Dyella sp. AtDHG13 TaxID=1938897 RepID=UPI0008853983|nr:TetR/AcrR family transcriptional regulator [Dyella sp. AtDHG13]PXV61544.1 TetR family transcriptional regulator [Dyella sp. AtDHG13]SDJ72009.1 transcriptional regulator, TetR family [Dyella jiangningensis]